MKKIVLIIFVIIPVFCYSQKYSLSVNVGWQLCNTSNSILSVNYVNTPNSSEQPFLDVRKRMDKIPNANIDFSYFINDKFRIGVGVSFYCLESTVLYKLHGVASLKKKVFNSKVYSWQIPIDVGYRLKLCNRLFIEPCLGLSFDLNDNHFDYDPTIGEWIDDKEKYNYSYIVSYRRRVRDNTDSNDILEHSYKYGLHPSASAHLGIKLLVALSDKFCLNLNAHYSSSFTDIVSEINDFSYAKQLNYEQWQNGNISGIKSESHLNTMHSFFSFGIGFEYLF